MAGVRSVEEFRAGLTPAERAMADRLRILASAAAPGLEERIKWNAPSFAVGGTDRITLGLDRKGGVRAVLHRGAKARDTGAFAIADPHHLARWPAPDRGVLQFAQLAAIDQKSEEIGDLFRRWLQTD